MNAEKSPFVRLAETDVGGHIEKKNNLSYLSWAWAVDQLLRADPAATWGYGEPARWGETVMVFCTVVAFGKPMTMQLPVMDHRNKAIPNPDAFAVNTAMMRCLVKAIALHGLGLYIYAGEDLPQVESDSAAEARAQEVKTSGKPTDGVWDGVTQERREQLEKMAIIVREYFDGDDLKGALDYIDREGLGVEEKTAVWSLLPSNIRSALKAAKQAIDKVSA